MPRHDDLLQELRDRIAELKQRDDTHPDTARDLDAFCETNLLFKAVAQQAADQEQPLDDNLVDDYWYETARLLISMTLPADLLHNANESRKHWAAVFNDPSSTPVIKNNLITALNRHADLKNALLQKKDEGLEHNAFCMAMRMRKNLSTLAPHLESTKHGAELAWLLQIENSLPAKFKLENPVALNEASSENEILTFIEPYLNKGKLDTEGQPMRPNLFPLVAQLSLSDLSFGKKAIVINLFLEAMKKHGLNKNDQSKVYNKFLGDIRNLKKNTIDHRASMALYKYTISLTTFVLASIKENEMTLVDVYSNWFSHKRVKEDMLKVIQRHLNTFAPLLRHPTKKDERTMLDKIIDVKKSGLFGNTTSSSRKKLNDMLSQPMEMEMKPFPKKPGT